MKRAVLILGVLGAAVVGAASVTRAAEERVLVEVMVDPSRPFVEEPVEVRLHILVEESFFAEHMIQLFHQPLDLPVQVEAPWMEGIPGVLLSRGGGGAPAGTVEEGGFSRFVLNQRTARAVRRADRERGGKRFRVYETAARFLVLRPGRLSLEAPRVRYAYATRFHEDLVGGRMPEDRNEVTVKGEGLLLDVRPLPEEGRPPGFSGAVGRFHLAAEVEPGTCRVGEPIRIALTIQGDGNLARFAAPRFEHLEGFHVLGWKETFPGPGVRVITYDMVPLRPSVSEVPSLSFSFFDPGPPPRYRTARTRPVPLEVRPPAGEGAATFPSSGGVPGVDDLYGIVPVAADAWTWLEEPPSLAAVMSVLSGPWVLAAGMLLFLRRRERRRRMEGELRARRAGVRVKRAAARGVADLAEPFAAYLAARLACPPPAVISPDLGARLRGAGVPEPLAERAAGLLTRLTAARYGGPGSEGVHPAAAEVVDALEAAFRAGEAEP